MIDEHTLISRRPRGLAVLAVFFMSGALISSLTAWALLAPGPSI